MVTYRRCEMKGKRKGTQREKGQSLAEFAIVLPFLLVILAGVLDLGRLYYVSVSISDAAAEGAAYAAINPDDVTEIIARAQAASTGLVQVQSDMVEVDCPVVASGQPVTVTVHYDFVVATPVLNAIVADGILPLHAIATEVILKGDL
ncbi:MAG TPA: pilus assembly protein [Chloroflexi bacterium]|nr:pilus assembly protein [Chloroflexota bacterium]